MSSDLRERHRSDPGVVLSAPSIPGLLSTDTVGALATTTTTATTSLASQTSLAPASALFSSTIMGNKDKIIEKTPSNFFSRLGHSFRRFFSYLKRSIVAPSFSWVRSLFTLRSLGTFSACWLVYFIILVYAKNLLSFPMVRYFDGDSVLGALHRLTRFQIWEEYSAIDHSTPIGSHVSYLRHSAIVHPEKAQNTRIKTHKPPRNTSPWSLDLKVLDIDPTPYSSFSSSGPLSSSVPVSTPRSSLVPQTPSVFLHVYLCGNAQLALSWMESANRALRTHFASSSPAESRFGHRAALLIDHPGYGVNEGKNSDISRSSVATHVVSAIEAALTQLYDKYLSSGIPFPSSVGVEFVGYSIGTAAALESGSFIHFRKVNLSPSGAHTTLIVRQYQLIAPPTSLSAVAVTLPIVFAPLWLVKLVWPTDFDSLTRAKEIACFNELVLAYGRESANKKAQEIDNNSIEASLSLFTSTDLSELQKHPISPIVVHVYHGDLDTLVPMRMGQEIANAAGTKVQVLRHHNHVSIVGNVELEHKMGLFRTPSAEAATIWHQKYMDIIKTYRGNESSVGFDLEVEEKSAN